MYCLLRIQIPWLPNYKNPNQQGNVSNMYESLGLLNLISLLALSFSYHNPLSVTPPPCFYVANKINQATDHIGWLQLMMNLWFWAARLIHIIVGQIPVTKFLAYWRQIQLSLPWALWWQWWDRNRMNEYIHTYMSLYYILVQKEEKKEWFSTLKYLFIKQLCPLACVLQRQFHLSFHILKKVVHIRFLNCRVVLRMVYY